METTVSRVVLKENAGEEIYPLEVGYLPEKFRKKAEVELNYTSKVRAETLRELKDRMADDYDLKRYRIPDDILLMFLNSRKYDVDRTLKQVRKDIAFRLKNIDMYTNINFETVLPILEVVSPLPWRCPDGCAIILIDLENWEIKRHPLEPLKHMVLISMTMCQLEPMSQVNGYKVIFNMNVSPEILKFGTPSNLYTLYYGTQQILPARLKEMHFLNMGTIGGALFRIGKMFLPEKLKKRVHIHASNDSLLKHFPKAIMPRKFGGDLVEYDMTDWLKKYTSPKALSLLEFK